LKKKLFQMMPAENIRIYSAQENLVLEGSVSSASNLSAAVKVADAYLPECISSNSGGNGNEAESNEDSCKKAEVVNLLSVAGSQQVMLEVKVAEMSRTFRRTWDPKLHFIDFTNPTRFGAVTDGASFPDVLVQGERVPFGPAGSANGATPILGPVMDEFAPNVQSIADNGLFFSDLTGNSLFSAALELSRQNGLAKVLAEPTLTTLTGRTAEFHSGGEFPIVTTTLQGTSVLYKAYGVSVKFLPTILGESINLDIEVEVSEIDDSRAQTVSTDQGVSASFAFPFLTSRSITNTVELLNGQTLGIAGLIQDDVDEIMSRLPGLGDIPILGNLFRSQQYQNGQTELVVFVTPHLAKPIAPEKVRLPTDSFVPPNDFEFYILGRMEGARDPEPINRRRSIEGGFDGVSFGHDL
jgi:pilus assembly protein CpaC